MTKPTRELFAVSLPGIEKITARELESLGLEKIRVVPGGVLFEGGLADATRASLWSRTASRILVRQARFRTVHLAELERLSSRVPWEEFIGPDSNVLVRATCGKSRIYHSGAAAQRVAGGILTRLKRDFEIDHGGGGLPESIEDVGVLVRIQRDTCTISIDSSGEHLHRRGYKTHTTEAPMRENLAAAFLLMAGFDGATTLYDPMCGSGTFPIEAALIARNRAPGLERSFAFQKWPCFDEKPWKSLLDDARASVRPLNCLIQGADSDPKAVKAARHNLSSAGLEHQVEIFEHAVRDQTLPAAPGTVICNPPYGLRLGDSNKLGGLYAALGTLVRDASSPWSVALITSDKKLAYKTGLEFDETSAPIPHGGIRIQLFGHRLSSSR